MKTLEWYLDLKQKISERGHADEIEWSEHLKPVYDAGHFWAEFAWVVLNSGMRNQVAQGIWDRVKVAVPSGRSSRTVFRHVGKCAAIDHVWTNREVLLAEYLMTPDPVKVDWLEGLPWIGPITKWHLAKNYGHDCAKPDRHLVRIAGSEGTHALCARLAGESGDRIATVDLVIWRAANLEIV